MSNTELLGSNVSYEPDLASRTEHLRVPLSATVEDLSSLEGSTEVRILPEANVSMNGDRYPECQAGGKTCTRVCSC